MENQPQPFFQPAENIPEAFASEEDIDDLTTFSSLEDSPDSSPKKTSSKEEGDAVFLFGSEEESNIKPNFVERVKSYPIISLGMNKYEAIKQTKLAGPAFNFVESKVVSLSKPVAGKLNTFGCNQLDKFESSKKILNERVFDPLATRYEDLSIVIKSIKADMEKSEDPKLKALVIALAARTLPDNFKNEDGNVDLRAFFQIIDQVYVGMHSASENLKSQLSKAQHYLDESLLKHSVSELKSKLESTVSILGSPLQLAVHSGENMMNYGKELQKYAEYFLVILAKLRSRLITQLSEQTSRIHVPEIIENARIIIAKNLVN